MRTEINLNGNWLFYKGDIEEPIPYDKGAVYSQSKTTRKLIGPASYGYFDVPDAYFWGIGTEIRSVGWKRVQLPHDYIIDQTPNEDKNPALGYFEYDNSWYRKHFTLPEGMKDKRVTLQFDGIAGNATVYLNGCLIKRNFSRYNSFEADITDNVFYDRENILAVYVEAKSFEGWWYQGGGIYRDVRLVITEPVAIDLYGVYAPARKLDDHNWVVDFQTEIVNDSYSDAQVTAISILLDAQGNSVATAQGKGSIPLQEKGIIKYCANVTDPHLWDIDDPYLYTVKTVLCLNDTEIDENFARIGFRTIELDANKGFLLNGKKTILKGVCCHQDFGLTGLAVPENVAKYKIKLIKEMGANAFRTSHYQNSAATMDALDELGFIVMDEVRWFESNDEALDQLRALVKRDRNRPSVVFWSTGNEEPHHIIDEGRRIHKTMAAAIRKLDNTRFVMTAQSHSPEKSTVFDDCDVIGINYGLEQYEEVHKLYPDKLIFASECCATGTSRGWYMLPNENGRIQDKDRDTNNWFRGRELTWKFLTSKDYIIGGFQWDAIEHRGEAMWPALCSKSGAIDLFLQKKGAFYQNKSHWTDEPMVHIVPHWNFKGMEGKNITVTVYTNCDEIELFLNGESIGKKLIEKYGRGEWNVVYAPGELKCVAYKNGEKACEHIRRTTKAPARLVLRQELEMRANTYDIGIFTCECVDEDGLVVDNATPFVKFSVNEGAKIVGTGSDNCDHNKVTLAERRMYAGKITVGVKAWKGEELHLYAENDELGLTELVVPFKK